MFIHKILGALQELLVTKINDGEEISFPQSEGGLRSLATDLLFAAIVRASTEVDIDRVGPRAFEAPERFLLASIKKMGLNIKGDGEKFIIA